MPNQPFIISCVFNQSMFQDFRHAAGILPVIQGFQNGQIDIYKPGHVKCPHHIFIPVEIHPRLTADTAVHLCQQGCGNLYKINSPQISSCRIASQIPRNTASQSDEHILAVQIVFNKKAVCLLHGSQMFGGFSGRKCINQHFPAIRGQGFGNMVCIQLSHLGICYNTEPAGSNIQCLQLTGQFLKAVRDHDGICLSGWNIHCDSFSHIISPFVSSVLYRTIESTTCLANFLLS